MRANVIAFLFAAGLGGLGSHLVYDGESLPPPPGKATIAPKALKPSHPALVDDARTFGDAAEFYEWLGSASATELERTLRELFKEPGEFESEKWKNVNTILRKLASIDPERAIDLVNKHCIDRHGSLRDRRKLVIGVLARTDVAAAVERALSIDPKGELLPVSEYLPADKTEELFQLMIEKGLDRTYYFTNLMSAMARNENIPPALAVERAQAHKINLSSGREYALGWALKRWHKQDPAAATAWLDKIENPRAKEGALLALAETWLQKDGLNGLEVLWPQLTPQGKQELARNLGSVRGQDISQTLDWLDNNVKSPSAYSAAIASLARSGLAKNPGAIGEIIDRAGESTQQLAQAVQSAVKSWAGKDPDAVNAFIESLTDTRIRNAAIAGVAQRKIWNDPLEAARLFGEIDLSGGPDSIPEMQNIAPHLAISLGQEGMELDEILELYPESLRGETAASYAQAFATQEPEKVLGLIEKTPLDYDYPYTFKSALHTWLGNDSTAAMDWFGGLEEGPHRKLAVETAVEAFANEDTKTASQWLENLPFGESKQAGEIKLAQFIAANDPVRGLELAQRVSDGRARDKLSEEALSAIASRRPDEALRLLGGAAVSEKVRQNITRRVEELNSLRALLLPSNPQR